MTGEIVAKITHGKSHGRNHVPKNRFSPTRTQAPRLKLPPIQWDIRCSDVTLELPQTYTCFILLEDTNYQANAMSTQYKLDHRGPKTVIAPSTVHTPTMKVSPIKKQPPYPNNNVYLSIAIC
jgi:hypothetical protein